MEAGVRVCYFLLRKFYLCGIGPRRNHGSGILKGELWIFGGEISENETVDDFWCLDIASIDKCKEDGGIGNFFV